VRVDILAVLADVRGGGGARAKSNEGLYEHRFLSILILCFQSNVMAVNHVQANKMCSGHMARQNHIYCSSKKLERP
jgi:hypothetical protein